MEQTIEKEETGLTAWNKMTGIKAVRLAETKDMPREQWLEIRRRGIGGSDIAAICGLNPFKSAIDVFLEKTGRVQEQQENEKMKWGKALEPVICDEFEQRTGNRIMRVNAVLQSLDLPYALANVDRLYRSPAGANGILEAKATAWAQAWEDDAVPDMYFCQVHWYMAVTGLTEARFATLINGNDLRLPPTLTRDENVIKNLFLMADKFWTQHVLTNTPPDPDRSPATKEAYKLLYPEVEERTVIIDKSMYEELELYLHLNEEIKKMQQDKSLIASKILAQMQKAKWGICDDKIKITRVLKSLSSIDKEKLQTQFPEAWKAVTSFDESIYPLVKRVTAKK